MERKCVTYEKNRCYEKHLFFKDCFIYEHILR